MTSQNSNNIENKVSRLIPMKDFFRNPDKAILKLSPDGTHLSFLKSWKNRLNIHVKSLESENEVRLTSSSERDIIGYMWANNNRIVFVQDSGGDENFRLYAVDIDSSNMKELTPFEKVQVQIVDDLEDDESEMLISLNKRDPHVFDVYRIDINTGEMTMVAENPGNILQWETDHDGKLRIATTTDGVNSSVLYRDSEDEPFQELKTTSFKETFEPLFFTPDNKNIYVASNIGRDKAAIFEYDIRKKSQTKLIFEHPHVDVHSLLYSKKRKIITGTVFTTDKSYYHFFDEERSQIQEFLEEHLPGYEVTVLNMSKDENKMLVASYSDCHHGVYYYYNKETGEFRKLIEISPWLQEKDMAQMKPISYRSRDGLTIPGYLTLPKGILPEFLPVVINPHGGPWYRDKWGFNPEVQFLANRGYAVLQMNFRGSLGYGRKFWEASFKQWGKKMQDDISDGVLWLIDQGIADPDRIAIYGASFGGYATLAGITFTPELYACAVDNVGVSNIFSWFKSIPPYWEIGLEMMYEMVGHPEKDEELLKEASPVFYVHNIKCPLLIAQGANDPRVPKAESDQMVEALKKQGIEVPYIVKENEGHGFLNEENRFEFYRAMEIFLAKHLGGRIDTQAE